VAGNVLTEALAQSVRIKALIGLATDGLSLGNAPDKNLAVTHQLQDASQQLAAMIQSLRIESRERNMVDHQLAAALEQEEGSRNAALHDDLTGLPNRVLFHDRLQHGIAQATRHRWILAVMFIDLDDFKAINDTYGHEAGDSVLQTVATRLRRSTRDDDTFSRYGGDEFVYLLNQVREEKDIAMIAAKILKTIQSPCDVKVRDAVIHPCMQASIGISVFPRDGVTPGALIRGADAAMYRAKENQCGYAFAGPAPATYVRPRTDGNATGDIACLDAT
jgi:diguanylate cyclase (GGDEF)-like protein